MIKIEITKWQPEDEMNTDDMYKALSPLSYVDGIRMFPKTIKDLGEVETQPYCCPVCDGNGLVPNGFYRHTGKTWTSSDSTPDKCQSCNGTGVIWNNK